MNAVQEVGGRLRKWIRRWLGIAAIQRQIRDLEGQMGSIPEIDRLNAATTRIAARFSELLDRIDELGTGNDDEVRAAARAEALQQASVELRPLVEQLETLGADAAQPVPEPTPEQVPVEPGPDVAPVTEVPADQPAPSDVEGGVPASDVVDEGVVPSVPGTQIVPEDAPAAGEVPGTAAGEQGGESVPGAPTDQAGETDFTRPADGSTGTENT